MGCASVKEKLESQMMMLKLQRVDIIQEREEKLKAIKDSNEITENQDEINPQYKSKVFFSFGLLHTVVHPYNYQKQYNSH